VDTVDGTRGESTRAPSTTRPRAAEGAWVWLLTRLEAVAGGGGLGREAHGRTWLRSAVGAVGGAPWTGQSSQAWRESATGESEKPQQ